MNNKGFSLLETLLTLIIVSGLFVISLNIFTDPDLSYVSFINEYLTKQKDALLYKEESYIDNYNIHFNSSGKVNKAQTINIGNKRIVIHLGSGYLTYE